MKRICLLGSTGSIGRQTLEIVSSRKNDFKIVGLACGHNIALMQEQIDEFSPQIVSVAQKEDAETLAGIYHHIQIVYGDEGLEKVAAYEPEEKDTLCVNALVGIIGLRPTLAALAASREVALSNKETLVAGGELVKQMQKETNARIRPIDSEHSGLWQCLEGERPSTVAKIYITASGGAFRDLDRKELEKVNVASALNHPNWQMGRKVTVDSATMMNKAFEMIEAHYLFDIPMNMIVPVMHRESLVHAMVEFTDGSVVAQMSTHDMRLAIAHALDWPERHPGLNQPLDFTKPLSLNFTPADYERYPLLKTAEEAMERGGTYPAVLNGANEAAVGLFLTGKISFLEIEKIVTEALANHVPVKKPKLENIVKVDREIKKTIYDQYLY